MKRNRQSLAEDKFSDRPLLLSWFKNICEVVQYLEKHGLDSLIIDELTSDSIFVTKENQVKIAVLECAIHATLGKLNPPIGIQSSLSTEKSSGCYPKINTYPLGMILELHH